METTDIVIHKGEKEEKYQLFVEDYVMSYLKNYKTTEDGSLFFYGKREPDEQKYYIFGAGRQENISYFDKYTLLQEVTCRYVMDMPVFSIKESSGVYELSGYNIFYHSNEAMQSYMIEQRKLKQFEEKKQKKTEEKVMEKPEKTDKLLYKNTQNMPKTNFREKTTKKSRNGLMAVQLAAIFVILAAIIINSTNSYTKLSELNQAAVEVFFAMENQEAADAQEEDVIQESAEVQKEIDESGSVMLHLEDINAKFEEENQAVQEAEEDAEKQDKNKEAADEKADRNEEDADKKADENREDTDVKAEEVKSDEKKTNGKTADAEESNEKEPDEQITDEEKNKEADEKAEDKSSTEQKENDGNEAVKVEEAFARNLTEFYLVEKGDTLCTISIKMYGDASKVNEICELNKISDPDNIKYGQKIILP